MLILLSGLVTGLVKARALTEREKLLLEWQKMLLRFRTEISFSARALQEIILSCQEFKLCQLAAVYLKIEENPVYAMQKAGDKLWQEEKDKILYRNFLAGFGTNHAQAELEHIELYAALLQTSIEEAKIEKEQKSRLYVALGGFSGITICMLIL